MSKRRLTSTVLYVLTLLLFGHAPSGDAQMNPGFTVHLLGGHGSLTATSKTAGTAPAGEALPIFFTDESIQVKASLSAWGGPRAKAIDLPVEEWHREIEWRLERVAAEPREQQRITPDLIESAFDHDSLTGKPSRSRSQNRVLPGDVLAAVLEFGKLSAGRYALHAVARIGEEKLVAEPVKFLVKQGDEDDATKHLYLRARVEATKAMEDRVPLLLDLAKIEGDNPGPYESIADHSLRSGDLDGARRYYEFAHERTVRYYEKNPAETVDAQQRREERLKYLKTVSTVYEYAVAHEALVLTPWTSLGGKDMFLWIDRKTGKPLGVVNPEKPGETLPMPNETIGTVIGPDN